MEKDTSLEKPSEKAALPANYLPAAVEPALCDRWEKDELFNP